MTTGLPPASVTFTEPVQPTQTDILVAIERLRGDIAGIRGLMEANTIRLMDHEERLRHSERSLQQAKGMLKLMSVGLALIGAVSGYIGLTGGPS